MIVCMMACVGESVSCVANLQKDLLGCVLEERWGLTHVSNCINIVAHN